MKQYVDELILTGKYTSTKKCVNKNKGRFIWLLVLLMTVVMERSLAQQRLMYTQYMFNGLALNPAYAGSDKFLNATVQARQQWLGFNGAPNSQMFSAHQPLNKQKIGIGMMIERESMAVSDAYNIYAMYSYKINIQEGVLSMGIQAGVTSYSQRLTSLDLPPGITDPSFSENVSYVQPNVGAGLYYSTKNYYVGVSVPYILQNVVNRNNVLLTKESRHYFITGGYLFEVSPSVKLKPNFLIKAVNGAPVNVDVNLNVVFKDIVWIGCSYRPSNSINPLLEIQLNPKLRIGFAYDLPTSRLASINSGSPEIMLNYRFIKSLPGRVVSPRYF